MLRSVRLTCWIVALLLAAVQAWAHRHATNPDGLSYLDLARALVAGDFETAISPYWGPLYPAFLALGLAIVQPSPEWVLPLVHVVNFGVFLGALVCFDGFLGELLRARYMEERHQDFTPALTDTSLAIFAYAVFVYAALALIGMGLITPDLTVAAACFAAAGLVLRLNRLGPAWATTLPLGLTLGIGYLAKSVMFPLAIILLGSLPLAPALRHRVLQSIGPSTAAFLAVASLLIVPISLKTASLTIGTSAKLTYAWLVNQVPYTNWQGDSTARSRPLQPPRRLAGDPAVFEYSAHLRGTYPPWFDPTHWSAGLRTEVKPRNQAIRLIRSGEFYLNLFLGESAVAAALLVALVWLTTGTTATSRALRPQLPLIIFGVAGLAIYIPINLDTRFVGAFAALLWILPPAAGRSDKKGLIEPTINRMALLCAACLVVSVSAQVAHDAWKFQAHPETHARVATFLGEHGVVPGDRVVSVGIEPGNVTGSSFEAFWAHLAKVQIVADVPDGKDFVCADQTTMTGLYRQFAQLGARAIVTRAIPSRWCAEGWTQVEGTDYHVRLLGGNLR